MLPYRALGGPLDPEIAFGFGLALSLAANVVTVVATAYAGLYATGRRSIGLVAAGLFAAWPFLAGILGGSRAWENGTWQVDAGLHLYTEPLSTALVTTALALLLSPSRTDVRLALAGVALGLAVSVKISNAAVAALGALLLLRRSLPYLAGVLAFVPMVVAFWPLGYYDPSTPDLFALANVEPAWTESLLFGPRALLLLLPLAALGAVALRASPALPALAAWTLANPLFYSVYFYTPIHPRFLFASLPALFVLWAAGADATWRAATARPRLRGRAAA